MARIPSNLSSRGSQRFERVDGLLEAEHTKSHRRLNPRDGAALGLTGRARRGHGGPVRIPHTSDTNAGFRSPPGGG